MTPEEIKTEYTARGYSIVAFTDHGNFYNQCHLTDDIYDLYVDDDNVIHVKFPDARMVSFITSNKVRGARLSENYAPVNSASFKITDDVRYVRAVVKDFEGNCAYSNPIFCDELNG